MKQVLTPGVKNRKEADLGAEMGRNRLECLSGGPEENAVNGPLVLQGDIGNLFGYGEDDMKILAKCCRQHLASYVLLADMWRSLMASDWRPTLLILRPHKLAMTEIYSDFRKAIRPASSRQRFGRLGPFTSQCARALAFISKSVSA